MSSGLHLRHWSFGHGVRTASEWCPAPALLGRFDVVLAELARATAESAFLIVPLRGIVGDRLAADISDFRAAGGTSRVCISGTRTDLDQIDLNAADNDHVGLLLDDVDADTPLSDLIWENIEAVRFSNDFVVQASRHLRLGYALESMLCLARDLGLCTLGVQAQPGGACVSDSTAFDYLPVPDAQPLRAADRTRDNQALTSLSR